MDPVLLVAPGGLSLETVEEWLGGPCGTAEEFLATLGGRRFHPRSVERVHFCLPASVADDPAVLLELLADPAVPLHKCIDMLYWSLRHLDDAGRAALVALGGNVERAVSHLDSVPTGVAGPYQMFCARVSAESDLGPVEREVFAALVTDRVPAGASANSWVVEEIIRECCSLAQAVLPS